MTVLLTTDTIGGVWNFTLSLARALPFRVHIATMGRKLSAAQRLEISEFPFEESEFPLEWMPNPWAGIDRAGEWLLALERKIKPDILHHNTVALAHLPFQAPSVLTVHSCVLSWWEAVKGEQAPQEWNEYRRRVTRSVRAAAEVIAPSAEMLLAVERIYGLGDRGRVVPNFAPNLSKRTQFCPPKEPFVFAAGRAWDEAKNLAALRRVAPRLSWPVHIAGADTELGYLEASEITGWYARAAIYAWPAKYEPFGLSVLEAAQHGCALVLGDIPSLRENWDGAALFVRTDEELFSAIQSLIADCDLRNELGSNAQNRSERFQAKTTVQGYSAAYAEVLSGVLCAS